MTRGLGLSRSSAPPESSSRPDSAARWLDRARDGVEATLHGRNEFVDTDAAVRALRSLAGDAARLLEGREAGGPGDGDEAAVRLRLVTLLRAELVSLWTGSDVAPSPAEMLPALAALEELRVATEPAGRHRTALDLGDPASLGLVVELAHDLRSPLTSILFLAEVLRNGRSGELNDLQRRQLGVVYSAAFALTAVADDLIDMARRGECPGREDPAEFSLSELFDGVGRMLGPMAEAKEIELRTVTPREDRRVGRPSAVNRVLVNLATNALKFTERGFVELRADPVGYDDLRFTVTDSGRGIPREARDTLFETFRKSRHRRGFFFSGSGLGLAIARRLVEEMGGRLEYETRIDQGTRFFFTLRLPPPRP